MAERRSQLCAAPVCPLKNDPRGLESIVRNSSVLFWASTTFVRDADHIADNGGYSGNQTYTT